MDERTDYPEEYTRGFVTFFGRHFDVNTHVLIPRLETEVLIKRARKILQSSKEDTTNKTLTIDIGCGSGIIGTSVADLSTDIIFLDISEEALTVARQNFAAHFPTKKAKFIVSDLLSCFFLGHSTPLPPLKGGLLKENPLKGKLRELGTLNFELGTIDHILLLANLPYVKADDWEHMSPDTRYEPRLALFGGKTTGFEMYERLFREVEELQTLIPDTQITLLCEFGFDQRDIAETVLQQYPKWDSIFFADYAGIERFVEIAIHK